MGSAVRPYFNRQAKYGGVSVWELKRLNGFEAENAKNSGADIKLARRFSASPTRQASGRRTCTASCKPHSVLRPPNAVVHREY